MSDGASPAPAPRPLPRFPLLDPPRDHHALAHTAIRRYLLAEHLRKTAPKTRWSARPPSVIVTAAW